MKKEKIKNAIILVRLLQSGSDSNFLPLTTCKKGCGIF